MSFGYTGATQEPIEVDKQSQWPTLSTALFRQHRRIPEFFEEQALADSLTRSAMEVQQQLIEYAHSADRDVPFAVAIDPASGLPFAELSEQQQSVYRGAVYARSHADLLGYFSAVDQREAGNNKATDTEQQDAILGQSNRAIRLLLGLGRSGVHAL
ncbi:head completion/stabilization protein [Shewanella algae]|uniref:head completion/stabilization protein n=1 Tax=Shewanella algae TaxID=38313 RepID=UPI0030047740